jgi:hypothetical protein
MPHGVVNITSPDPEKGQTATTNVTLSGSEASIHPTVGVARRSPTSIHSKSLRDKWRSNLASGNEVTV